MDKVQETILRGMFGGIEMTTERQYAKFRKLRENANEYDDKTWFKEVNKIVEELK